MLRAEPGATLLEHTTVSLISSIRADNVNLYAACQDNPMEASFLEGTIVSVSTGTRL